jgi:phosphate transport system protein
MKRFDYELADIQQRLSEMGDLAVQMVTLSAAAVKDRTRDVGPEMYTLEKRLNQMQVDIDRDAIRMLTVYGPVAADLRYLLVVTHVTAQLERMGDQAVNIVESLQLMRTDPATHPLLPKVCQIADLVLVVIDEALDSFFSRNADKAVTTRTHDDMVDALDQQIMKALLTDEVLRQVLSGATDIADAVAQILISRYFERIADQATNVCKEVIYLVRGDDVRHTRKT